MCGIESVKKNSQDEKKFDMKTAANGKWYLNLKATNSQIVGISEMYNTEASCKSGIQTVRRIASSAGVADTSAS